MFITYMLFMFITYMLFMFITYMLFLFMTIGLAHHKLEEAQSHKQATIDQIIQPHGASD